jgi:hypothetical protein
MVFVGLFLVGIGVVVGLTALTSTLNPKRRAAAAGRFAAAAGVPLTPELSADVVRRLRRRDLLDLGARVVAVALLLLPVRGLNAGAALVAMLAALGGGRTLAHLTEVRRAAAGQARVTHLVPPRLTGYLRPVAVYCVRAVALLPVALAAGWFLGPARQQFADDPYRLDAVASDDRAALIMAGLAAASLLLTESAARLVLRMRRVAGNPAELTLDDAFRVSALRDLAVLPVVLGVAGSFAIGSLLAPDQPPWFGLLAVGLVAVAVAAEASRRRAWVGQVHPQGAAR